MIEVKEIYGNIFNTQCQVIVNAVNCKGVMGRGIAHEFKLRYPEMFEEYKRYCDEGYMEPGILQLYTKSNPQILNFPTKNDWKQPSKIEYLELGLEKFKRMYDYKGIKSIAFPLLGSSAGGLDEEEVVSLMHNYLSNLTDIEIEIYRYDKSASDNRFDKFKENTSGFSIDDYIKYIGITKSQSLKIIEAMESEELFQTVQFQFIKGIGEKTLEKIHRFIDSKNVITGNLFG